MNLARNLYELLIRGGSNLQSVLLFLGRLIVGLGFVQAGLGKFTQFPTQLAADKMAYFDHLTIMGRWALPAPKVSFALAASTEVVGGALLAVGLASRLVSVPLAFTMIVAYLTAHWVDISDLPAGPTWKDPYNALTQFLSVGAFPYLLVTLTVIAFGPGKLSLDALAKRFFERDED